MFLISKLLVTKVFKITLRAALNPKANHLQHFKMKINEMSTKKREYLLEYLPIVNSTRLQFD